jgi:putative molybdopterin biosynthesis protein
MPEIDTNVGQLRQKRGYSAIQLAQITGVSRQTIYAIEAGTYVPNTAVALRLARALDSRVEDLFALPDEGPALVLPSEPVTLIPGADALQPGQPVQLCRVDAHLIASPPMPVQWYFPASDAVLTIKSAGGKAKVQVFQAGEEFRNRILVAGCDPGISVLARHVRASGIELVLAHRNSSQSLQLLKDGCIHIAGTHLRDDSSGESNIPEIGRLFVKDSVAVISFAVWEEGILTARGNPKGVRGIEDFAQAGLTIVNRETGAGARNLLDAELKRLKISPRKIRGYDKTAPGHLPAAWQVQRGAADCCISTRAAARVFGLGFIPLVSERYDLAIRRDHLDLPGVQALLDTLNRSSFRRELESLGGYDTRGAGQRRL